VSRVLGTEWGIHVPTKKEIRLPSMLFGQNKVTSKHLELANPSPPSVLSLSLPRKKRETSPASFGARLKKEQSQQPKTCQKSSKTYRATFTTTPPMRNQLSGFLRWLIYLISERLEITKLFHKFCVLLRAHDTTDAFSVFGVPCRIIELLIAMMLSAILRAKFCRGGRRSYRSCNSRLVFTCG
jgi:hypothetical protein